MGCLNLSDGQGMEWIRPRVLLPRLFLMGLFLMGLFLIAGCTVANPDYQNLDQGGQTRDLKPLIQVDVGHTDRLFLVDGSSDLPPPDLYPPPDIEPWHCQQHEDCQDNLSCTQDICDEQQRCAHPIDSESCLVLGACYQSDDSNPQNPCQVCAPGTSQTAWTAQADWTTCPDDNAWCTEDVCANGQCTHLPDIDTCLIGGQCIFAGDLNPDNSCEECRPWDCQGWCPVDEDTACDEDGLWCTADHCQAGLCIHEAIFGCQINGACYNDDQANPANPCQECVPQKSTTAFTFIDGKECTPSQGLAGVCFNTACHGWEESTYEPISIGPGQSDLYVTSLTGVAYIPPANQVWAVGYFTSSIGSGGLMIPLGQAINIPVITLQPFRAIHYRLAVGDEGIAWYHNGTTWLPQSSIESALNKINRTAVWGAPINGVDTFFLAGYQLSDTPGVLACVDNSGNFSCTTHDGIDIGTNLGGIVSTQLGAGQGPLWAVPFGGPEDIYHNGGIGTLWSRDAPQGCQDFGPMMNTVCSNTNGDYRHIYASAFNDVWVVGSGGLLFHFDGQSWTALLDILPDQAFYTFDAIYSSPADHLVTLAAHSIQTDGRAIVLFNYNTEFQRWFGPITLVTPNNNLTDEILDIDGKNYAGLWMVGQRTQQSAGGTKSRQKGWILQLK